MTPSSPPQAVATPAKRGQRTSWAIHVEKEYHKFSAAHFLIFDDGTAERLHGHNYRVAVDLTSSRATNGMVLDFKLIKPLIGSIIGKLDECFLVAGHHPSLRITQNTAGETEIRFGSRRYVAPSDEVVVLPIDNSSAENLAEWIANALADSIYELFPDASVSELAVSVEETAGQRGIFTIGF